MIASLKDTMELNGTSDISPSLENKNNTEETTTAITTSVSIDETTMSTSFSTSVPTSIPSTTEETRLNSTITSSTSPYTTNVTNSTSGFFMSNDDNEDDIIYIICGTILALVVLIIVVIVIYVLRRKRKRKGLIKPKKDYPVGSFVKRKRHGQCEIENARPQHLELGQQESLHYQNVEGYVDYLNRNRCMSQAEKEHYLNVSFYPTEDGKVLNGDNSLYVNDDVVIPHYINTDNSTCGNTSDPISASAQPMNHVTNIASNQSHDKQRQQDLTLPGSDANQTSITSPGNYSLPREKEKPALEASSPVLPTERSEVKSVYCVAKYPTGNSSSANTDGVITATNDSLDENADIVYSVVNKDGQHDVNELCAGKVNEYFILEKEEENSVSDYESNDISQPNSEFKQEESNNSAPFPDENRGVYFELEDEHEYESYSDVKENFPKHQHSVRDKDEKRMSRVRSEKWVQSDI